MQRDKEAPPDPLTAALRMLARRPYSVAEMRRALAKKYPDSSQVPKAIARLRELHYLDDKKFAEHYASSLARNRAYGRYRIRRELKAKLVDYRQIEPALQQAFGETSERELLERTLEKKLRTLRLPLTRPRFHSLCQSLLRRGFNSGDIIKAVRARPELQPVAEEVEAVDLESGEKENSE
ncbi:MAG: regulatory protein RecX [Terriglobia bacterium]